MKTLKLEHELAQQVVNGQKTSTWRLFDDKNFNVNDTVAIIDKADPNDAASWQVIGEAVVSKIVQKRLRDVSDEDYDGHERYESLEHMLTVFRGYYKYQSVEPDTPVKILYFDFRATPVENNTANHDRPAIKHIENDVKKSTSTIKLYADGGSRGNPGPSACGYVLLSQDNQVILQNGVYLGVTTNNVAEYQGLKLALEAALKIGAHEVKVYLDSMLVVNQMKGIFKVKNRDLWPIHDSVKQLSSRFKQVSFTHVPRELNKLADAEVNKVLDAHQEQRTIVSM